MTSPSPQFRPRRSRQPEAPRRRPRWLWPALATGALGLVALGIVLALTLSGDDDPSPSKVLAPGSSGSADGRQPTVAEPAFAYNVQAGDMGEGYETFPTETYVISRRVFATNGWFKDPEVAEQTVDGWGFLSGYQASLQPEGQIAEVVRGEPYVRTETYLFRSTDGAKAAFAFGRDSMAAVQGSNKVDASPLANESVAFKIVTGTVGDLPAVYYRYMFRRGTLVTVVQVYGADQFTSVDRARELAVLVDEKALGERPAPTPTPPRRGTPTPPPVTPTARP